MPGPASAIAANRRFSFGSSGGSRGAAGSCPASVRSSAPWPPIAGSCSGEKRRSSSLTGRPLTKARAPPVRCHSRASVSRSECGTNTSRGVGARSRIVPSTSSRMASSLKSAGSGGWKSAMTLSGDMQICREAEGLDRGKRGGNGTWTRQPVSFDNPLIRQRFRDDPAPLPATTTPRYMAFRGSKRHAAVDQMRLPGNVARLVGGQEDRERGHLLGPAEPPHRLALDEGLLHLGARFAGRLRALLDPALERGRFDGARTDRIGADALRDEVGGDRLGQSDDRGFAGAIDVAVGNAADRGDRGRYVDDRAGLLRQHPRQECLDRPVHRLDVEVERKSPVLLAALEHAAMVHVAGAVDQDVEGAMLRGDGLRQRIDRGGGAHVELEALFGLEPVELLLLDIGRDHARALGGKSRGDGAADALSGRSHERELALQSSGHGGSSVRSNELNGLRGRLVRARSHLRAGSLTAERNFEIIALNDLRRPRMGNLHVRNLDDDLIARLKRRAARHGRSTEAEHREILRQALACDAEPSFEALAAELRNLTKNRKQTPSEILLREGRDER